MPRLKKNILFPIFSGLFLAFVFPPFNLTFLWPVALIPLFYFLIEGNSKKSLFWASFLTGFIFFGILMSWFFSAHPLNWAGIKSDTASFLMVFIVWLASVSILALFMGFFGFFSSFWAKKKSLLITLPSLWVIFEYLRAWGFGFFWYGQEALLGPHWTFGFLGYLLHDSRFLNYGSLGGVYGLSFLVVLVNVLFLSILVEIKKGALFSQNLPKTILIIVLLISALLLGPKISQKDRAPKKEIKAALLQTNFPSSLIYTAKDLKTFFLIQLDLLKKAAKEKPDLIIFPEGSRFLSSISDDQNKIQEFLKTIFDYSILIIDNGFFEREKDRNVSRLIYFDTQKGLIDFYDKSFLVPGGEYIPYSAQVIGKLIQKTDLLDQVVKFRGFKKGVPEIKVIKTDLGNLGGLVCSGIISSSLNRDLVNKKAEILITISSDAVFRGNKALLQQNIVMSKIKAVESNRYFLQATNQGYSFVIDNFGEIKKKTRSIGNDYLIEKAKLISEQTLYSQLGNWVLLLAILILTFKKIRKDY